MSVGRATAARRDRIERGFGALDAAGIRWLLLRGDPGGAEAELDVLVDGGKLRRAAAALETADLHRLPAVGHPGHRFFVAYHPAAGRLTLDVVTDLAYGPGRTVDLPAGPVLDRRIRAADAWRPAAADAFWLRLLHAALDRNELRPSDREAISEAWAAGPVADSPLAAGLAGLAPTLVPALASTDPRDPAFERLARALRADLVPRSAGLRERAGRPPGATKLHTALRRPGIAIALLGPDGAGKSTVSEILVERLPVPARRVYLGLYADRASGRGPARLRRLGQLVRARITAAAHLRRGRVVVLDRHPIELGSVAGAGRPGLRRRLSVSLAQRLAPTADVVIVLDASVDVLMARKREHDAATIAAMRERYAALARREGAIVVDATRPVGDVADEVALATWRALIRRWRRG
ncbi:MAG TPA: hypothetical protein VFS32_09970 [Candidatus Limnocylindrales bacterium]|nr:hypothetical protein [Candidatus Limnocylindrales bacterium]